MRAAPTEPCAPACRRCSRTPWSALNPKLRIGTLIEEPLRLHTRLSKTERRVQVADLARRVHLSTDLLQRLPADLSGGQLQRVCIARAIATEPRIIVLDEPTSALDLSVRAGVLDLLMELKARMGTALVLISHDLGTVRLVSDRIVVLYLGTIVEQGTTEQIFAAPAHPYTKALISAYLPSDPRLKTRRTILAGDPPSPTNLPPGCGFAGRCPVVMPACSAAPPALRAAGQAGHLAACLRISDAPAIPSYEKVSS